jgi:glycosyltransferase involved in cell wall biosynthesis
VSKHLSISVGIPAYNQGEYLEETIVSLLEQRRPPDEIVISDQYSTDSTPDVIAKYAKHVRGLKPPPDCGISGQWNFTLSSMSGDWLTLLSSDDVARPNFCEVLLRGAAQDGKAVHVRAGFEHIDGAGAVLSPHYLLSVKKVARLPENLIEQRHSPKASFAAFAVRREALEKAGGYPRNMESFGDWPLFVQLAPFGSFVYEHEIISGYRVGHDGNKFRNRLGLWVRDEVRMFSEVFPLAADRAGMKTAEELAWITEACRDNFMRYLEAASEEFALEERVATAATFAPWAEMLGEQALLRTFAGGARIRRPVSLKQRVRNMARPMAQKMASVRQGLSSGAIRSAAGLRWGRASSTRVR